MIHIISLSTHRYVVTLKTIDYEISISFFGYFESSKVIEQDIILKKYKAMGV